MDRREFLQLAAVIASLTKLGIAANPRPAPEIAFTFDDPKTDSGANLTWREINQRILAALAHEKLQAALFVCGKRVDSDAGRELIGAWDRAGHLIANHSHSHLYFNASTDHDPDGFKKVTLRDFEADATKNEPLLRDYPLFARLFRYPFFKEGDTVEKRDGMRAFLHAHGYRIGRATIDASDWAISARMEKRVAADTKADLAPYRDFFLQHIWERAQFYDSLAQRLSLQPVRHTVVLHHNALNAYFAGDLIAMFRDQGWKPVHAGYAYQDAVYDSQPQTLPAGESLIWALAKESGRFERELRYPGEDDVYENPRMDELRL